MDTSNISRIMQIEYTSSEGAECSSSESKLKRRLARLFVRRGLRAFMALYLRIMKIAKTMEPRKRSFDKGSCTILLTGTFYSDNWIKTHLRSLALSSYCKRIYMVAASPVPSMEKVTAIYPENWLIRCVGAVPARLLTCIYYSIYLRPHIIGGFHLLVNGLLAAILARLLGARSLYFCGGGPREVEGGGYLTENRLFKKLREPDTFIEQCLLKAIMNIDLVIAMGSGTVKYFQSKGINSNYHVMPGGFDSTCYYPTEGTKPYDLVLVGRLSAVKRVDIFLNAVVQLSKTYPTVSALVVGNGPLKTSLAEMAIKLNIENNVTFVGHQEHVDQWLRQSKIFVLTSDSEGLSQAMIEAMLCGLPVVVSNVGDLSDIVQDGVNGYLISDRTADEFAAKFRELLIDKRRIDEFGLAATRVASKYSIDNVSNLWDDILKELE